MLARRGWLKPKASDAMPLRAFGRQATGQRCVSLLFQTTSPGCHQPTGLAVVLCHAVSPGTPAVASALAIRRSAMAEALTHISKALDLLACLPVSAERHQREFRLQLARAGALAQTSGWASAQMGEAYFRACELSRIVGEDEDAEKREKKRRKREREEAESRGGAAS